MFISGKNHTDYPEEDNIIPRHQYVIGIEIIQIFCFLRPAQGRERPQRRGKPCIQRVLILFQMRAAAFGAFLRRAFGNDHFLALAAIICRNPMPPPKLSGNTPVPDIVGPVKICFFHTLWKEFDFSVFDSFNCRLNQFIHFHKPLLFDHRLYRCAAAVVGSYVMGMRYYFDKKPHFL